MDADGVREEARQNLAQTLLSESEAYGYTLTIWGSGTLLVIHHGTPSAVHVFAFVAGALVGFAALTGIAFGDFLTEPPDGSGSETRLVLSMVHFLATFGNLLVIRTVIVAVDGFVPLVGVFSLIGFLATVVYNLLLLVEHVLPSEIA